MGGARTDQLQDRVVGALRCADDVECGRDGYRCRVIDGVGRCAPGPKPLPDHVAGNAWASDDDFMNSYAPSLRQITATAASGRPCSIPPEPLRHARREP